MVQIDRTRVAAAFVTGAPLLENTEYRIHASRREEALDGVKVDREATSMYPVRPTSPGATRTPGRCT